MNKEPQKLYNLKVIWHPYVHIAHEEILYFYFLRSAENFEGFSNAVNEVLEDQCQNRYSKYQLFGDFDILIRLWQHPAEHFNLMRGIQEAIRPFGGNIEESSSNDITYLWVQSPQPTSIPVLDEIRSAQKGDNLNLIKKLEDSGAIVSYIDKRNKALV